MKPSVEGRFVLFSDNLEGQIAEEFKKEVANAGGACWYGLPGATDIWQPVDAGYAELVKVKWDKHINGTEKIISALLLKEESWSLTGLDRLTMHL